MRYIYEIITEDGFFYVGKHQWSGEGIDPSYHGSGARLKDHPFKSISLLEDCSSLSIGEYNQREVYWIEQYAKMYGVVPFYDQHPEHASLHSYVHPQGRLLNCHASLMPDPGRMIWFINDEGPMLFKDVKERTCKGMASTWIQNGRPPSFYWRDLHIHQQGFSGGPHIHERGVSQIQTRESFEKASMVRRSHRQKYTNGVFTGDYEQIAQYIGYTGKDLGRVSSILRGKLKVPKAWPTLAGFKEIK